MHPTSITTPLVLLFLPYILCHQDLTLKLSWDGFNASSFLPLQEHPVEFYEAILFDRVRVVVHQLEYYLDHKICPTGFYCTKNNTLATPCPPGSFNPLLGQDHIDACQSCPFGTYCPEGSNQTTSCPAGTWGSQPHSTHVSDCSPCPEGFYCPFQSIDICPNGTYTPSTGNKAESDCLACPIGHFCAQGVLNQCPIGYYSEDTGQPECQKCSNGTYTYDYGLTETCPPCPIGYFCYEGNEPETCPENTTSVPGASTSLECYCIPGLVCDASIRVCPPNTVLKPGGVSIVDCICEEGYDCDYVYTGDVKIEIIDKSNVQDPVLVHHAMEKTSVKMKQSTQLSMKKKQSNIRLLVQPENDFLYSFE